MNRWHTIVRSTVLLGVTFFTPLIAQAQSPVPEDEFSLENAPAALQDQSLYQQISPLPQVYVTKLVTTADDKNVITGSFEATSGEAAAVANIQYELQILQPLPLEAANSLINDDGVVYDRYLFPETFALSQQGSHQVSFTFDAAALPAGSYRTRIQLSQTNDRPLGWGDAAVTLTGERPFIVLTTDGVTVESTDPVTQEKKSDWEPKEGPNVAAGQTITIKATASNLSAADITGKPVVAVERILSTQRTVLNQAFDAITIPVGADQDLSLPLITEATPGAYRVLLSLHDTEGKRVSGIGEFRYVVVGPSASIVSQLVKELPVRQGSTATVDFTVAGAADRVQNITGTLEIVVSDDQGIIGQAENVLVITGATPAQGTAAIVLQRDRCGVPKITLIAKNQDGTELDRYEAAYPNFTANCSAFLRWSRPLWLALGAIVILILAALYFILRRRRRTPAPPNPMSGTIALIIGGIVLLTAGIAVSLWDSNNAQANGIQYIAVTAQETRPTLYVASPIHNSNVTSNSVYYSASFTWLNCDNKPAKGFLKVYAKADGGQVNWSTGHSWVELAKNTLNLPAQCWRCRAKPVRKVALSGMLQLPALAPGGSNTLWSYGDNTGSWIGGSIVQDFTWLNFPAPAAPPSSQGPTQTISPTCSTAQAATFTFNTAWKIREFINSFPQYNDIQAQPDVGSGAARGDDVTALKVCQLKGYQSVVRKTNSYYRSCWDNTVGRWDPAQNNFVIANACSTGGVYLWSLTCGNPMPAAQCTSTPTPTTATSVTLTPQCSDGKDNDGDSRIDAADPGCHTDGKANNPASYDPNDNTEADSIPQCRDGIDNDGDGKIDTIDAGCHTDADASNAASYNPDDTDETNTHCSDGKDNDGDTRTDSADPGCHTDRDATNTSSYKPSLTTEADQACSDNKDNDGDGKVDRNDPGCRTKPSDPTTYNPNKGSEVDPGVSPGPIQETE